MASNHTRGRTRTRRNAWPAARDDDGIDGVRERQMRLMMVQPLAMGGIGPGGSA